MPSSPVSMVEDYELDHTYGSTGWFVAGNEIADHTYVSLIPRITTSQRSATV